VGGDVGGVWGSGYDIRIDAKTGSSRAPAIANDVGSNSSAAGTVHGGCNYQFGSNFVVGLEGDFTWFGNRHTNVDLPIILGGVAIGQNYVTTLDRGGLATARARFGYAVDRTMFYGTVCAAWVRSSVFGESASGVCLNVCDAVATFTDVGVVGGVGVEYAATNWLLLRAEYLYAAVGRDHAVTAACPVVGCIFNDTPHLYTWRTKDIQQFRIGASIKFGGY
jgi:outer membrane immunogenic protein